MGIPDAVAALVEVVGDDRSLIPVFKAGEMLTLQRGVGGQNVLMHLEAEDPCSIGPGRLNLKAKIRRVGVSSYADGRVATQLETINRLMAERDQILELAIKVGANEIVDLLTGEGTKT